MKFTSKLLLSLVLVLIGFLSVADLVYRPGHPVTFDGHIHMTTMNQFAQALYDGEFPVTWANNFTNYGHPLANIAHQIPAYLGALLILSGFSTELAYITLLSLSVICTGFLFYTFFRKFADKSLSLTATVLATFFPYRELNIYTRGGLPELMATLFLPILLLGVWNLKEKKYFHAVVLLYLGVLGTALTHPMMLLIFAVPVGAYFFFSLNKKLWQTELTLAGIASSLGILSASYYLIPLFLEMKYFYQGNIEQKVGNDTFLSLKQLYDPTWFYTLTHPGPRGNYIKLGTIEFIILILALILLIKVAFLAKNRFIKNNINFSELKNLKFWTLLSIGLTGLMLPVSKYLYQLPVIYQIQYPWRFLTDLQITIPLVFIFLVLSIKKLQNNYFYLIFIALILFFRLPQFYGKNYIAQPEKDYYFNQANLHSTNFNTVWSGNTEDYERKTVQAAIIEGEGNLEILEEKNASRTYKTTSDVQLRMIDYTFYFSGWAVYIDGVKTIIQWQDPNYRGIITYTVPAGTHEIKVVYEYTQVRSIGVFMTIAGVIIATAFMYLVRSEKLKSH